MFLIYHSPIEKVINDCEKVLLDLFHQPCRGLEGERLALGFLLVPITFDILEWFMREFLDVACLILRFSANGIAGDPRVTVSPAEASLFQLHAWIPFRLLRAGGDIKRHRYPPQALFCNSSNVHIYIHRK